MIVILEPNIDKAGEKYLSLLHHLSNLPNIQVRIHEEVGTQQILTEFYLIGNTAALPLEDIPIIPGVERVV
ncbi:MAG: 3-deoxy-7-phosphoheptulonate synthase, partial [Gammaproteobacteria bacterium]